MQTYISCTAENFSVWATLSRATPASLYSLALVASSGSAGNAVLAVLKLCTSLVPLLLPCAGCLLHSLSLSLTAADCLGDVLQQVCVCSLLLMTKAQLDRALMHTIYLALCGLSISVEGGGTSSLISQSAACTACPALPTVNAPRSWLGASL